MPPKTYTFTLRTPEPFNQTDMRKINENEFASFTISGNGWNLTVSTFQKALREWNNLTAGTLFGNRPNGTRAIIDTK